MVGNSATGTCSYNGYTFDGARTIKVQSEPARDEANRTVIYVKHTVTVDAYIAGSVDLTMETIRRALTHDGQQFIFINEGFGTNLIVNGPQGSGMRDVMWGPKTNLIAWESVGDNQACHVVWQVTVCVPECINASYTGIMALNFDINYDIDEMGDTTRTIAGYVQIAQTWNGTNRTPTDTADAYWEKIKPEAPNGFHRKKSRHLSKDKSRLDFTIVDREIPSNNPYPAGATFIEGRHSVRWTRGNHATGYRNVISMRITPRKGFTGSVAWAIFVAIVQKRLKAAITAKRWFVIDDISVEEDIFGRPCSFNIGWQNLSTVKELIGDASADPKDAEAVGKEARNVIGNLLSNNSLFQPIGTNWQQWKQSLALDTFAPRGHAGLSNSNYNDAIVDLCGGAKTLVAELGATVTQAKTATASLQNVTPPRENSWINFKNDIVPEQHNLSVQHAPLQEVPSQGGQNYPSGNNPAIIQVRGAPHYVYYMTGHCTRAGYPIDRPSITSIGGQAVTPYGKGRFRTWCHGVFFGLPVYKAIWHLAYVTTDPIQNPNAPDTKPK